MKKPEFLCRAALICLCSWMPFSTVLAESWQPEQLMHLLSQKKSGTATFTEKKYIGILDQPLVSSGTLSFQAPDKLEKNTLTPQTESLVLEGDSLTIARQGKRKMTVRLADHPEAAAFIEGIRGTLVGDLTVLQTYYDVELSGSADNWQLTLTPKQERMSRIFSSIRIAGAQADVQTIHLQQRDGDRSDMFITPTHAQ